MSEKTQMHLEMHFLKILFHFFHLFFHSQSRRTEQRHLFPLRSISGNGSREHWYPEGDQHLCCLGDRQQSNTELGAAQVIWDRLLSWPEGSGFLEISCCQAVSEKLTHFHHFIFYVVEFSELYVIMLSLTVH